VVLVFIEKIETNYCQRCDINITVIRARGNG